MPLAFRISLGLNITLVLVIALLIWREGRGNLDLNVSSANTVNQRILSTSAAAIPLRESPGDAKLPSGAIARLEREGFSRSVVVQALLADFDHRWDRRLLALEKLHAPRQLSERQHIEFARLRETEQIKELKEALGEEGFHAWDREQTLKALNTTGAALSPQEAEQAFRLQKEFDQKHQELQLAMEDGVADKADATALQERAREALERDLEKLFGKRRLDELRGITDPLAEVNSRYADLRPTAEQAGAVLQVAIDLRRSEDALAQRLRQLASTPAVVAAELKTITDAQEENLRRVFGADAYENQKRQNDPTFKTLRQFADAWELKEQEVHSVYTTLEALHGQVERTRTAAALCESAGQQINWREINSTIEQLQQNTEVGLQTLIGPERVHRLKQNGLFTSR